MDFNTSHEDLQIPSSPPAQINININADLDKSPSPTTEDMLKGAMLAYKTEIVIVSASAARVPTGFVLAVLLRVLLDLNWPDYHYVARWCNGLPQ